MTDEPLRLGITGGAGSGKSAVCERLSQNGAAVVLADELARQAVMPGMPAYKEIVSYFGTGILNDDGSINRAALRREIVRDEEKKRILEGFVHPEVFRLMEEAYQDAGAAGVEIVAIEVPLLFETGMEGYFDYVVAVYVEKMERLRRLMERDGIGREDAEALMRMQWPEEKKEERSDFVIDNSGTPEQTNAEVDRLYADLTGRGKKS